MLEDCHETGRRGEAGEGRSGTLFALIVLGVAIYLGVKFVPVLINVYSFRDAIDEQARFAGMPHHDDDLIKKTLLAKARELDLPIGAKEIQIERGGNQIRIRVIYTVPVETPVHTFNMKFDENLSVPIF